MAICSSTIAADAPDFSKLDLAKLPQPAGKTGLTFTNDIRPLFEASCFRCHGQDRPKGGLRLDSLESALKGGKDGAVIVAGNSKQSWLVVAAAQIDEQTAMPPRRRPGGPGGPGGARGPGFGGPGDPPGEAGQGDSPGRRAGAPGGPGGPGPGGGGFGPKPLSADQVALVRAWIDQGAK